MLLAAKTALQPIPIRLPQLRQSHAECPNPETLRTPLVASLVAGHREVAHYLLAHGADPSLVSELDYLTPLQAARKHRHEEFVALFLQLGVKEPRRPFWWRWLPGLVANAFKTADLGLLRLFYGAKSASSPINTGASSY